MIAKNYCLMKLRDKGKYTTEIDERVMSATDQPEDKKAVFEKEDNLNRMAGALQQLNAEQQQCITLFYLQKKSYREITEITSFTILQVKSHIQNGKRNLKIIMEEE